MITRVEPAALLAKARAHLREALELFRRTSDDPQHVAANLETGRNILDTMRDYLQAEELTTMRCPRRARLLLAIGIVLATERQYDRPVVLSGYRLIMQAGRDYIDAQDRALVASEALS